jgi:hypothetical protein
MKDLVGRSSVRNVIYMMRQVDRDKTVLIVEGDSDSRSFARVIRTSHCRLFAPGYPGGKEQAIALFDDLKQKKLPGVAALVDADCDRLWGRNRGHPDICWTSVTDRELMIIQSQAFAKFVLDNFTVDPDVLRLQILMAAFPLGCLRTMSRRNQWALDFKSIDTSAFIEITKIMCDERACCREVLAKNLISALSDDDLLAAIGTVRARNPSLHDVVCGHDATEILSLVSGPTLAKTLSHSQIEQQLADRYEPAHFLQTSTFQECAQWELRNTPFLINK